VLSFAILMVLLGWTWGGELVALNGQRKFESFRPKRVPYSSPIEPVYADFFPDASVRACLCKMHLPLSAPHLVGCHERGAEIHPASRSSTTGAAVRYHCSSPAGLSNTLKKEDDGKLSSISFVHLANWVALHIKYVSTCRLRRNGTDDPWHPQLPAEAGRGVNDSHGSTWARREADPKKQKFG
jgi:hypothetical protein